MAQKYLPPECEESFPEELAKKRRTWTTGQARAASTIQWSHPHVGTVVMATHGFWLGNTNDRDGYYYAEIEVGDRRPANLLVTFSYNLGEGIIPFFCQAGQVIDCGDRPVPSLRVPIDWERRGSIWIPRTRKTDQDNADLLFRDASGHFINLQVSVLSRAGIFYLSIQEVGSGQILRLPENYNENSGYRELAIVGRRFVVAPLFYEHAYPGADWLRSVMPRSGPKFVEIAVQDQAFIEAVSAEIPEWDAEKFQYPAESGWTGAIVLWFNPLIGARVMCPDEVEAFVPLGVIPVQGTENDAVPKLAMKVGGYPLVLPAQQVLVQLKEGDKGRYATAIKPMWPK